MNRIDFAIFLLILAGFALSGMAYNQLPDPMPTHWSMAGIADGFTPLPWGAFILPMICIPTYALLRMLPAISPKGFGMEGFAQTYQKIMMAIIGFLVLIHAFVLWAALTGEFSGGLLTACVGALLIVIGNYMNKTQPNFFVGIRTPWTLADPEVWARTHRVGGWGLAIAGLVTILAGMALSNSVALIVSISAVAIAAIAAVTYSYLTYRRLNLKADHA